MLSGVELRLTRHDVREVGAFADAHGLSSLFIAEDSRNGVAGIADCTSDWGANCLKDDTIMSRVNLLAADTSHTSSPVQPQGY